jgi:hypothetical protein
MRVSMRQQKIEFDSARSQMHSDMLQQRIQYNWVQRRKTLFMRLKGFNSYRLMLIFFRLYFMTISFQ